MENYLDIGRRILGAAMVVIGIVSLLTVSKAKPSFAAKSIVVVHASETPQMTPAPKVQNAKLQVRNVAGNLEAAFREVLSSSDGPTWIAYSVEAVPGQHSSCCGYGSGGDWHGTYLLEGRNDQTITETDKTVALEQPERLVILFRSEGKRIQRIRIAREDCTLDVGGLPLIWLTGGTAKDSVHLLASYVHENWTNAEHEHGIAQSALTAIAQHADTSADQALESFVAPTEKESLRKQAAFWLGAARGKAGVTVLIRLAENDPSPEVRAHVAFALNVSKEPNALDEMIHMARTDQSSHVRGQALFWLAHKAGERAVSTIDGAIENDPDTEVKKKAVFALSQMPKDEGIPKLIEVAQTNRNREVRKQAMFWLGQSNDPRALNFFEKVLSR